MANTAPGDGEDTDDSYDPNTGFSWGGSSYDFNPFAAVDDSSGDIVGAIKAGIAGVIITMFTVLAAGVDAAGSVVYDPLNTLASSLSGLVSSMIPDGFMATAVAASSAAVDQFGVWAYPIGMIVMAMGLLVLSWLLSLGMTSNLVPFSATDFPLIGSDEEER